LFKLVVFLVITDLGGQELFAGNLSPFHLWFGWRPNHKKERANKMPANESTPRVNRTITIPVDQEKYLKIINDPTLFRKDLDVVIKTNPELFPQGINMGYLMKDIRPCKKLKIDIRRIEVDGIPYTVRPSFVMPYGTALTDDVEKAIFLRKFDVPFWALSHVFGKDPMFWYRIERSLGRNSIVGTTIKDPKLLPEHLSADEKHSRLRGEKVYVATTVGNQCILGASVSDSATEAGLTEAYGKFKAEACDVEPAYAPKSVNTDGWKATMNAWKTLFSSIFVICCFLHIFIKIRDRSSKKYRAIFNSVADKIWDCYRAGSKSSFSQRVRRLYEWVKEQQMPDAILKPIQKLKDNLSRYSKAYDLPGSHRTSNMVDRLLQRMDRHLFSTFYFHGDLISAELSIRGWALIHNFAPCNPMTVRKHGGFRSPAERLNQFRYHENWLQNLLISASMGGFHGVPPNPLYTATGDNL
jgi:hypothetical protein